MFTGLEQVAFWVMRLTDSRSADAIRSNDAWALMVHTGWPNYKEVWAIRKDIG